MNKQLLPLKESEIKANLKNAFAMVNSFNFVERKTEISKPSERSHVMAVSGAGNSNSYVVKLTESIKSVDKESPIETEVQHKLLSSVLRGVSIGNVVAEKFEENSELKNLLLEKRSGNLSPEKVTKFNALQETRSVITAFVLASYVIHKVSPNATSETGVEINLPKIDTSNPLDAVKSSLFGLNQAIKDKTLNDTQLASIAVNYFKMLADSLSNLSHRLESLSSFENFSYEVKSDEFHVSGFDMEAGVADFNLEMDFVEPQDVIGNAIAKHQAMRLARILVSYDFERQMNPFVELGGHVFTFMGDGKPGTGKTTLVKMMAGLMKGYCDTAGYPFYFENFGTDNIDSYQGKSGKKTREFINNVNNPKVIGLGTIDDIDQVAGKRGDKSSSAGQQEITAVLMDAFAGSGTVIRGNSIFGMLSNFPENVDDALRQRAGARFDIDGPKTAEDFTDLLSLMIGENNSIPDGDIELFVTQEIKSAVKESYEQHNKPQEPELLKIYNATVEEFGEINTKEKIGKYLKNIQKVYPKLAGRDMKNITDSIKNRAMDFDMPDEWFGDDPSVFLHQSYEVKLEMIRELQEEVTPAMAIQELNRYVDSEFRYKNKSDNARRDELARDMKLQQEALEHVKNL